MQAQKYRKEIFQSRLQVDLYRQARRFPIVGLILAAALVCLNFSPEAKAQGAGSLDATFGAGGKVKTAFRVDGAEAYASAIQSDGKIVTAGQLYPTDIDFAVARYNTDGSLDNSFGAGGKVIVNFNDTAVEQAKAVVIQPDGKIVVAGATAFPGGTGDNIDFAVARLNRNGTLDTTFNGGGKVTTDFGTPFDQVNGVAIDSSNRILAVGRRLTSPGSSDIALARYNSDGTLDFSFGTGGKVSLDLSGTGNSDFANAVVIQPWDGRIVTAGYIKPDALLSPQHFAARFLTDGSLDSSFGTGGKRVSDFSDGGFANAVALDAADRSIISAGAVVSGGGYAFGFVRYTSTGNLDSSFGSGGKTTFAVGAVEDHANNVFIQPDGKIVAAGISYRTSGTDFALVRLLRNGAPDATFGTLGKVITFISGRAECFSVNLQTDGKIIASGWAILTTTRIGIAVVRYTSNGALDSSFDADGIALTAFGSNDSAEKIAVQSDGKIVVAGFTDESRFVYNRDFALTRYNADGTLDTTFGTGGKVATDFRNGDDAAYGLAIQADGKIVAVGASSNGVKYDFAFARYNLNGSLDTTFDGDGKAVIDFLSDNEILSDVAIQPDGSLIAVGSNTFLPTVGDFVCLGVKPNGTIDTTFGAGGIVQTDFGGNDNSLSLALQPDGKIVVVGDTSVGTFFTTDFAVARYKPNGTLDTTFDGDGKATVSFGAMLDRAFAVKIGADGNPVVAGFTQISPTDFDFAVARFKTDGSLDAAFDGDGKTTFSFGAAEESATGLAIQTDGKIVAAGYASGTSPNFALARLDYGGALDTTFDADGKITTDFGGADVARGVAIQADGKIIAAGVTENNSDADFAIARYNVFAPTAAAGSISGRVTTADGRGIRNAYLSITGGNLTEPRYAQTGTFGYYHFDDLPIGETYVLTVRAKRFVFAQPTLVVNLFEDLTDVNFMSVR